MIERFGHGGDIWTAAELFGRDKEDFLDFSSNMNPLGPPEAVERIVQEHWRRELTRYPDPDCRELRQRIAGHYGVPPECVLAGNGAAELIDLAVRAVAPATVGLLRPCFAEYAQAARRAGASVIDIPLSATNGFVADAASPEVWELAGKADLLLLGHPNNPTGQLLPEPFLARLSALNAPVVLDEAFIDFSGEEERHSRIRQAAVSDKLLVVRSMTKFFTVPGLRLGFIVAGPAWISRMKALQVEWSVNGLAQRIGNAVLDDLAFAERTMEWLRQERPWLKSALENMGFDVTESAANYLLFRLPDGKDGTVSDLQRLLGAQGILLRNCAMYPGLDDRYARTAVRLRPDNERLAGELAAALALL